MRHFLTLADLTPAELQEILDLAVQLKTEWKAGGNPPLLGGKVLGMIFQKPSLRTRVSFDMAMLHLGGHALYLSPNEIQLGKRESTADVARVLARYVHVIMARVFDHADVVELAKWSTVPVINGLSDYSHPCQGIADFLTILEHKGTLKGRKLAYLGDSNNVTHSLIFGATKLGMDFALGAPAGYSLRPDVLALAEQFAAESGSRISISTDPRAAIQGADVVYTDTWTSMGQEAEAEERRKIFPPYQVNPALLAYARPDAIVMHCLPAHRGDEITDEVADGPQSVIFDQAENRMHAQKAILLWVLE
ncbi:MAG TPA: ornithine carbamoyltransferase [Anaerolineae bacterium]|nr:MAG: Ornithine carbamoyltransferase [Chloroflexi bacterium ADurb.Bin222]HOC20509.1 ornithine carbamoyltransferase [Anaerolineae bacterium]HQM13251.1 ornithine carbamoyltransferase [Anaerolineae bacterium]